MTTRLRAGTSGYSYKEWKGVFYPEKLPAKSMLAYYAQHFGTVEINNTFYRLPKASVLEAWRNEVPADFVFVLKAPQRITHHKRLKETADTLTYFHQMRAALGPHAGPTLFQLPPNLRLDLPRLSDFLALLPLDMPAAFEFRHASWFDDNVYAALSERNASLCLAEVDADDGDSTPRVATANWGYVRLRKVRYSAKELANWRAWIAEQQWQEAFVFFKHEDAGTGPKLATQFLALPT